MLASLKWQQKRPQQMELQATPVLQCFMAGNIVTILLLWKRMRKACEFGAPCVG